MLKKTIEYTDYNGEKRSEDFYFNLSKAECVEMQFTEDGSLAERLNRIINEKNAAEIIKYFKKIVLDSYGVKSDDGKRFIKNDELKTAFSQTEAYTELFMELATDEVKASEFIKGILPADLEEQVKKIENN